MELSSLARHINQDRRIRVVAAARLRDPVLLKLVPPDELEAVSEIEGATSARLLTQERGGERLDRRELVFDSLQATLINAAFCLAGTFV